MMFRLDHACKNRENAKFSKIHNDMIIFPITGELRVAIIIIIFKEKNTEIGLILKLH